MQRSKHLAMMFLLVIMGATRRLAPPGTAAMAMEVEERVGAAGEAAAEGGVAVG